jgi:hypothetical protein
MNNRTLQALIVYVFIFGCTTVSLLWTGLDCFFNEGAIWKPAANTITWLITFYGAVLCYRELRVNGDLSVAKVS